MTPLRDGMNLVAKEYVACRTDNTGALVLSEFAGAANEMQQAFLVNPHDADGVKRSIMAAVAAPESDTVARMKQLREQVFDYDVARWLNSFMEVLDAARQAVPR